MTVKERDKQGRFAAHKRPDESGQYVGFDDHRRGAQLAEFALAAGEPTR